MRRTLGLAMSATSATDVREAAKHAMLELSKHGPGGSRPKDLGSKGPRSFVAGLCVLLVGGAACGVAACESSSADQVTKPVAVGIAAIDGGAPDGMMPAAAGGEMMTFQSEIPVPLPVRAMTAADVKAAGPAPAGTPYPRGVFLQATDESIEIHFTLSNVDTTPHNVWLLIDPWNEFVRWRPGETVTEEAVIPNFGYDQYFTIPAQQRVVGTITSDDVHEIAIKLASVEQLLASPQAQAQIAAEAAGTMTMTGDTFDATSIANNIFNPQNRSNSTPSDLLYTPWIPPVIPGITGFDLGLRTSEQANVAVEITMEVQDLRGDRFVAQDSSDAELGVPPVTLSPPNANF